MPRAIQRRSSGSAPPHLDGGFHPVLARVYAARGVRTPEELDYALARLHPFTSLTDIDYAAELLGARIRDGGRILVIGDFDADGATSCALAVRGLRLLGARQVSYLVPNRFEFGYGLTPEIVAVAAERSPDLLVTVDNGISSVAGVEAAARLGIDVVITDHHLPGPELPAARAIVNPNRPDDPFPSKHIAGVGVMFYLLMALRAHLRSAQWFGPGAVAEPNLAQLLDLVALGTVADLVTLDHNNRILVAQGLARIRAGQCGAGIAALLGVARRELDRVCASDLAFAVAPRLNAAGRLTDMSCGIECLLAEDAAAARQLARQLDSLNVERRSIEGQMHQQALEYVEALHFGGGSELPFGLCLFDAGWHQGVIGILASRVKEQLHRPVIAFAPGPDGILKGSARSVPGLHIRDALQAVAARQPGLIAKFGGHAMAAGLTLTQSSYEPFCEAFDAEVRRHLGPDDLKGVIASDGPLEPGDLSLELAETLRSGGPWGQGFPEPVFDGEFELVSRRLINDRHLKLKLRPPGSESSLEALAFGQRMDHWPADVGRVKAAYRLDVNFYRGNKSAQLTLEHVEPCG